MILAGLWYDVDKPTMTTFLQPLLRDINHLFQNGKQELCMDIMV